MNETPDKLPNKSDARDGIRLVVEGAPDSPETQQQNPDEERALQKVLSGESTRVFFSPFPGAVRDPDVCTLMPLHGHKGVFAIIDHSLLTCVGYTTDKKTPL
jgi:hypothetical protein